MVNSRKSWGTVLWFRKYRMSFFLREKFTAVHFRGWELWGNSSLILFPFSRLCCLWLVGISCLGWSEGNSEPEQCAASVPSLGILKHKCVRKESTTFSSLFVMSISSALWNCLIPTSCQQYLYSCLSPLLGTWWRSTWLLLAKAGKVEGILAAFKANSKVWVFFPVLICWLLCSAVDCVIPFFS